MAAAVTVGFAVAVLAVFAVFITVVTVTFVFAVAVNTITFFLLLLSWLVVVLL